MNHDKQFKWKVEVMCHNCPFRTDGQAIALHPHRLPSIKLDLLKGKRFSCHKTTKATGDGTDLYCAGALAFQLERGIHTAYMALCESFQDIRETKATLFKRLKSIGRGR